MKCKLEHCDYPSYPCVKVESIPEETWDFLYLCVGKKFAMPYKSLKKHADFLNAVCKDLYDRQEHRLTARFRNLIYIPTPEYESEWSETVGWAYTYKDRIADMWFYFVQQCLYKDPEALKATMETGAYGCTLFKVLNWSPALMCMVEYWYNGKCDFYRPVEDEHATPDFVRKYHGVYLLSEFLYALVQAYRSPVLKKDREICRNIQNFMDTCRLKYDPEGYITVKDLRSLYADYRVHQGYASSSNRLLNYLQLHNGNNLIETCIFDSKGRYEKAVQGITFVDGTPDRYADLRFEK